MEPFLATVQWCTCTCIVGFLGCSVRLQYMHLQGHKMYCYTKDWTFQSSPPKQDDVAFTTSLRRSLALQWRHTIRQTTWPYQPHVWRYADDVIDSGRTRQHGCRLVSFFCWYRDCLIWHSQATISLLLNLDEAPVPHGAINANWDSRVNQHYLFSLLTMDKFR